MRHMTYALQVVVAFLAQAVIPLILATISYACGVLPEDFLNDYDRKFFKIKPRVSNRWAQGSRKGFFVFSIQELVLGIAILSAGFMAMSDAVVFDFQTVIYQGWMCTAAHFFTSMLLRDYFRKSVLLRSLEVVSLLILLGLLGTALYPTTNWAWAESVLIPNACLGPSDCVTLQTSVDTLWQRTKHDKKTGTSPQGVLSYVILAITGISQIMSILHLKVQFFRKLLLKPFTSPRWAIAKTSARGTKGKKGLPRTSPQPGLIGLYCFLLAISILIRSFAFCLWISAVAFGWGTMQLFIPRFVVLPACVRDAVTQFSFGQILPLIILITPLYGVIEYFSSKCHWPHRHTGFQGLLRTRKQHANVNAAKASDGGHEHPSKIESKLREHKEPDEGQASDSRQRALPPTPIDSDSTQRLHDALYSSPYFKSILIALTFIAFGIPVGFFAETVMGYIGPYEPMLWWTVDWHLWPVFVGAAAALGLVFMAAVISPYTSEDVCSKF